jgi:ComF family protein
MRLYTRAYFESRKSPMIQSILDWLLPRTCIVCGFLEKDDLCSYCLSELPRTQNPCITCAEELSGNLTLPQCGECLITPPPFDRCVVLFNYRFPIPSLITQLKFSKKLLFADPLGSLLCEQVRKVYQAAHCKLPDVILPVPLSTKRLRERGYNQAMEIARPISKALNIPLDYKSLIRKRSTLPQTLITFEERQLNVRKAFLVRKELAFQHVAIVDDVATTFSTLSEIAKTLQKNGVEKIDAWCLAKA